MRLHLFSAITLCFVSLVVTSQGFCQEQQEPAEVCIGGKTGSEREARIFDALRGNAKVDFFETRMEDVLSQLASDYRIQFILDASAADNNLDGDALITSTSQDVSLKASLRLILAGYQCRHVVDREVVQIVSDKVAADLYLNRYYDCRKLVSEMRGDTEKNFEKLIHVLRTTIDPKSWDANGGKGGVAEIDGLLFVLQNSDNHDRIAGMLTTLLEETTGK